MRISEATLKKVGEVSVDGGMFIIIDPSYLDLIVNRRETPNSTEVATKEWHGHAAHWGDGDYPIYEIVADDGFCHGLLIMT